MLKHVARHVSGQQCESYLMKVARLRLKVAKKRMRRTEVFQTSSMHQRFFKDKFDSDKCANSLESYTLQDRHGGGMEAVIGALLRKRARRAGGQS